MSGKKVDTLEVVGKYLEGVLPILKENNVSPMAYYVGLLGIVQTQRNELLRLGIPEDNLLRLEEKVRVEYVLMLTEEVPAVMNADDYDYNKVTKEIRRVK